LLNVSGMHHIGRSLLAITLVSAGCIAQGRVSGGGTLAGGAGGGGTAESEGSRSSAGTPQPKLDDFSFGLKEYTGSYARAWITNKLTKFKVGQQCWTKMIDDKQSALHTASFYTSDIEEFAKKLTGDDWSNVEAQNQGIALQMIDAFGAHFQLTIHVDGDDCDTTLNSLWMRYWSTIGKALKDYPPASGNAFITLEVTPAVRDITVTVEPDGSTFRIIAPRDLEPSAWDDKIEKPFRKRARASS